jgi:hypothetical protein
LLGNDKISSKVPRLGEAKRYARKRMEGWEDRKKGKWEKKSWVNGDRKQGIIGIWIASLVAGKSRMMGTGNYHILILMT